MKIILMQKSFLCGNIAFNLENILKSCETAKQENAILLITPYLSLTGLPLLDLLKHDFLFDEIQKALHEFLKIKELAILVSYPQKNKGEICIVHSIIYNGNFLYQLKTSLDGLLLEKNECPYFNLQGIRLGIINSSFDLNKLNLPDVDGVIFQQIDAFYDSIREERLEVLQKLNHQWQIPILSINPLGANDQYIYEGGSFSLSSKGLCQFQSQYFISQDYLIDFDQEIGFVGLKEKIYEIRIELLYHAIIFSLQQYLQKIKMPKICLGLSGGIDSALVLAIACKALGAENCEVFLMPGEYTSTISNELAVKMAEKLKVPYSIIPIINVFQEFKQVLSQRFTNLPEDETEENIQARARGILIMALANKTRSILLCTSNKSEAAVGYGTLYGDTNGGFAPIKDLLKTDVYEMARWINQYYCEEIIPQGIIDRQPSAELKPNQVDQDSLPDYKILDEIIQLILFNESYDTIVNLGFLPDIVAKVMKMVRASEFKRQQSVLGPKLTPRSFGKEWNYPITHLSNYF